MDKTRGQIMVDKTRREDSQQIVEMNCSNALELKEDPRNLTNKYTVEEEEELKHDDASPLFSEDEK